MGKRKEGADTAGRKSGREGGRKEGREEGWEGGREGGRVRGSSIQQKVNTHNSDGNR